MFLFSYEVPNLSFFHCLALLLLLLVGRLCTTRRIIVDDVGGAQQVNNFSVMSLDDLGPGLSTILSTHGHMSLGRENGNNLFVKCSCEP